MPWNDNLEGPAYRVAASTASHLRVQAGPGTGKTFAMMRRIARLLENNVDPNQILACTFTRVAANDLKRELQDMQISGASSIQATTLHSFCFSLLQKSDFFTKTGRVARIMFDFEIRFLLQDLVGFGTIRDRRKMIKAYEAAWATEPGGITGAQTKEDRQFQRLLEEWLRYHRAMLIGELIPQALRYLQDNPIERDNIDFTSILVDEYQDLNVAEQKIIDLLGENADITIIGDEDQSIYSFRHAHPHGIRNYHKDHENTDDETLLVCRRCPKKVVAMANSLIDHNSRTYLKNGVA